MTGIEPRHFQTGMRILCLLLLISTGGMFLQDIYAMETSEAEPIIKCELMEKRVVSLEHLYNVTDIPRVRIRNAAQKLIEQDLAWYRRGYLHRRPHLLLESSCDTANNKDQQRHS